MDDPTKSFIDKELRMNTEKNVITGTTDILEKKCPQCEDIKSMLLFNKDKNKEDGHTRLCKKCIKENVAIRIARYNANRVIPASKICFTCKDDKPAKDFHTDTRTKDGLGGNCSSCANDIKRMELSTPEAKLKNQTRVKEYYQKNKKKVKAYQRQYNIDNHDKVRTRARDRENHLYHTDPEFRITQLLRKRLRVALNRQFIQKKYKNTFALLGMSLQDFKGHLESKFNTDMTWDKFLKGEIHVDHIIPCAAFNLQEKSQQALCFHYTNLQPLWAEDNLEKGDNIYWIKEEAIA